MNKSIVTNLVAVLLIIVGFITPVFSDLILSIGYFALSGAITNWLAIHMLFEKVPGLYGSGVIPNHFVEFKAGIKHLIMEEFFTKENIDRFLNESEDAIDKIDFSHVAETINYNIFFDKLSQVILSSSFGGMLGMFGGASALESFREPFAEKMKDGIVEASNEDKFRLALKDAAFSSDINRGVEDKIITIIESRLEELTPKMVKQIIQDMIKKHLGWLVVWGGVFGGLIGAGMNFIK
ncbi:DUF445 domain-containing protein [Thiospirochaeta perfilievii]|uniref:DUF445 domain-containing protein n=1 Tax=Thiospirochaeta perfilievii TaxID=252967 RepID=A0A5C1QF79_9SPIO|nr:DUF445 domain-containing protein [Thiospirochaeta perfilievii]QEN06068.1 DUF445 domain-containing protein [Thiospirochaeta perfilievii]